MATLGFGEIMSIAFVEAKGVTGGTDGFGQIPSSEHRSARDRERRRQLLARLGGGAASPCCSRHNIVTSRPGRAMRAMHGSELGASACGIDVMRLKIRVFVISAGLAGLAGSLYAHLVGFVSPSVFSLETR